jgi:hypothetical protein
MKRTLRITASVLALTLMAFVLASAQRTVAPPPRPADSSPSLAATMQFIQDKLNGIGRVTYDLPYHYIPTGQAGSMTYIVDVTQVKANPAQCNITFHFEVTCDGVVIVHEDYWVDLKQAQDVVVMPMEQHINGISAGTTLLYDPTTPPILALTVRHPLHGKNPIPNILGSGQESIMEPNTFPFSDPNMADRVAKAMVHAIELCGGGNKSPF